MAQATKHVSVIAHRRHLPTPAPRPMHRAPAPTPTSDFQTALQAAFDEGSVLHLNAPLTLEAPVAVKMQNTFQGWVGFDGGMNKITSLVNGAPAIRLYMDESVPQGTCSRGMFVGNFSMLGCGEEANGLQIDVPFNDRWLVNPELRSLWFEGIGGNAGLAVMGSIFEGNLYSVGTMDCKGNGIYFANAGAPDNFGVVSALRFFGGTQRQNGANGIAVDQYNGPADVRLFGLYFCGNADCGIYALAGLELVDACGFENNYGGQGIYVENFATLRNCTGSTYGPQGYLVRGYTIGCMTLRACGVLGYGGGTPKLGTFTGSGSVYLADCDRSAIEADNSVTVTEVEVQTGE